MEQRAVKRPSSGSGVKGGFSNTMIKLGRPGEGREGHLRKRDQNVQRPRSWRVAPSLELCVLFFFLPVRQSMDVNTRGMRLEVFPGFQEDPNW